MKTKVWFSSEGIIRGFCAWEGELPSIPPPGTLITVFDGWCAEEIKRCYIDLETMELTLELRPDYSGEYRKEVEGRQK